MPIDSTKFLYHEIVEYLKYANKKAFTSTGIMTDEQVNYFSKNRCIIDDNSIEMDNEFIKFYSDYSSDLEHHRIICDEVLSFEFYEFSFYKKDIRDLVGISLGRDDLMSEYWCLIHYSNRSVIQTVNQFNKLDFEYEMLYDDIRKHIFSNYNNLRARLVLNFTYMEG